MEIAQADLRRAVELLEAIVVDRACIASVPEELCVSLVKAAGWDAQCGTPG